MIFNRSACSAMSRSLEEMMGLSVVPIWCNRANGLEHVGSAVYVKIGPVPFLLTAGHVLDWIREGALLFTGQTEGKLTLFPLHGNVYSSTAPNGGRSHDKLDFAHFLLSQPVSERLNSLHHFVQLNGMQINDSTIREGFGYSVVGYPCAMNSTDHCEPTKSRIVTLQGARADQRERRKLDIRHETHLAVPFVGNPFSKIPKTEMDGFIETNLSWEGMSGGAIWRTLNVPAAEKSSCIYADLVGITLEYDKRQHIKALIGLRLEIFLASICSAYPWILQFLPQIFSQAEIEMQTKFPAV